MFDNKLLHLGLNKLVDDEGSVTSGKPGTAAVCENGSLTTPY